MIRYCVLVLLLVAGSTSAAVRELDENGDGKADQWIETSNSVLVEIRCDGNYDGKIDSITAYTKAGKIEKESFDHNYDGVMDTFYFYVKSMLARQEIDSNYDGKVDIWITLAEGIYIAKIEKDVDFDGKVDSVKDYMKR